MSYTLLEVEIKIAGNKVTKKPVTYEVSKLENASKI